MLVYSQACYANEPNLYQFRNFSKTLTFNFNVDLPGRVWQSQDSEWIEDVSEMSPEIFKRYIF